MKAMILYRDRRWIGGVVSFLESLRHHLSSTWQSEQYQVGLRFGNRFRFLALLVPFRDAFGLFRAVTRARPDVVHINPSLNLPSLLRDGLFMLVLRMLGTKGVLVFWHGWEDPLFMRIRRRRLWRALFKATFGSAGHAVVLASRFRDDLLAMGLPAERVSVESTMFDGALFQGIKRQPHEDTRLLFLSRMEEAKGVFELVDAFARVKKRFPGTTLVMAGDGPARKALEMRVDELRLSGVSFPGYLRGTDKAQALADADLYVLPSHAEGCPVSLLEAMAAGIPCITNSVGGIPDIFRDGVNGVLLNGVSADLVAEAMARLLGDSAGRALIGQYNRDEAWQKYEASAVTRRIESLYLEVAKLDAT